jgi:hypothetical protein
MSENGNGARTITEIIDDGVTVNEALDKAFYRAIRQPRTLSLLNRHASACGQARYFSLPSIPHVCDKLSLPTR